jgi:hypothetical protein
MRKQFNHVFIGSNGTGKTTLMIQIAIDYLTNNPNKRILIIVKDDDEEKFWNIKEISKEEILSFKGVKKLLIENHKDFDYITDKFKSVKDKAGNRFVNKFNGLMICDDLGAAMNRRPDDILNMFKRRRQINADFIWAFHGLRTDVPPSFYTYVNSIFLFRTSDNHDYTMEQLPHAKQEIFETIYNSVQETTETEPHHCEEIIINPLTI